MHIDHIAMYVRAPEEARDFFCKYLAAHANNGCHNQSTGDGCYESCILAIENNQIEITV